MVGNPVACFDDKAWRSNRANTGKKEKSVG
jgi:hypothetical protein